MKRFLAFTAACILVLGMPAISVSANSLDDVVGSQSQQIEQVQPVSQDTANNTESQSATSSTTGQSNTVVHNSHYVDEIKQATDLSEVSAGASKLNEGIKKVASFIVQVLSYFITAFLVVRIVLDICYITLPFTRSFLANGYQGNAQAGVGMADGGVGMNGMGGMGGMGSPMGGMGMSGMGMGGMSGMGMGGMYGRGRYGMGGMGMNGGMMGQQGMQGMQGANPIMGRIQWVSTAALNAVAAESSIGPDGKPDSPIKVYIKEMTVVLILTPILLVLAITGALTELGFLLGELLVNALQGIGNMI